MTAQPLTVRSATPPECRNCNASVPVDEHFCPNCSRIQSLGRHGDYFSFLGLPRRLVVDAQELDRRFRELSRKFHPDFYYNASPAERLASLERSSYLNDAYRALKQPASRIEHLLAIEGLPLGKSEGPSTSSGQAPSTSSGTGASKVPPGLLEEVFALNEELDEIRELRESGADRDTVAARLAAARMPIEARRDEHEHALAQASEQWDRQADAPADERRATLESLRRLLLERNYIANLLSTIEREAAHG
jgi:molecular chaperone HscB